MKLGNYLELSQFRPKDASLIVVGQVGFSEAPENEEFVANFIDISTENINSVPQGSLKFHYGDSSSTLNGGLCLFKATENNLTVTYIESNGLELYQTVLYPRMQ